MDNSKNRKVNTDIKQSQGRVLVFVWCGFSCWYRSMVRSHWMPLPLCAVAARWFRCCSMIVLMDASDVQSFRCVANDAARWWCRSMLLLLYAAARWFCCSMILLLDAAADGCCCCSMLLPLDAVVGRCFHHCWMLVLFDASAVRCCWMLPLFDAVGCFRCSMLPVGCIPQQQWISTQFLANEFGKKCSFALCVNLCGMSSWYIL